MIIKSILVKVSLQNYEKQACIGYQCEFGLVNVVDIKLPALLLPNFLLVKIQQFAGKKSQKEE